MDIKATAKNIKKYRMENGYTQKQLAEKIGKAHITVKRYESGHLSPSPYAAVIIARVLGVSMMDILRD